MDQFGVHMNFLQIKQVLYINNLFLFYFYLIFEFSGLGHKFQKAQGLLHKAVYDTERPLQDCGFIIYFFKGLFVNMAQRRGTV
jgi:hypothetical protein